MAADRVRQRPGGQLPVGLRLFAALGEGERAAQGLVDGGGAGQQRVRHRGAVGLPLPADLPAGLLEPQDELDGGEDRRPHPVDERVVAGGEVVVPDADGHVGAEVGLQAAVGRLLRVAVVVGRVPGAVLVLVAGQPLVRAFRGGVLAGRVQGHGGLGVVPRVEVVAAEPRNRAVFALHGEHGGDGLCGLLGGEHSGQDEVFGPLGKTHASALTESSACTGASAVTAAGRCGLVA